MKFKRFVRNWIYAFLNPHMPWAIVYLPRYIRHWLLYQKASGKALTKADSFPCLTDWVPHTPFDAHYFYQAAWLARQLADARPEMHVDVGSDVRMINVLSAFVKTEFVDFRPLPVVLKGLECKAGNITSLSYGNSSIASLSCLHVIEHIGLGRYGDPIDPAGSEKALHELKRVLASRGRLYLSVPVGRERVCFNAHRVFDPKTIITALSGFDLLEFSLVDDSGAYKESVSTDAARYLDYGCGLFVFEKP